jgi:CRP-like cAMP-binding protein
MVSMDKEAIKRCLQDVPLFSELSTAELQALAASARDMKFRKGARIFEEGAPADCCFVLTQGKARVVLSGQSGMDVLLHIVTPPRLVGEVALLDRSTRSASLLAVEDCHLLRIPGAALEMLRRNAAFENKLVAGLAATLREADDHVRVISTFPARNRVAWCLARIGRYTGTREGAAIVIARPPDSELGEMAGCTRETVSRCLKELRQKRLVTWDGRTMRLDINGMERYLPPG